MTHRVTDLIERLGTVQRAARRARATSAGLSLAQLDALDYLASCNRFSNTPAAAALFLDATRGTTSQSLLALERKGLVTRSPDPGDGRVQHLSPTPLGRELLEGLQGDGISRGMGGLEPGEAEILAEVLARVLGAVQRARGGRTFGECQTCIHLRGAAGAHLCGLTGEALSDGETTLRCAEHTPADGRRAGRAD